MNGFKYLLDTNFILGLLKSAPEVLSEVTRREILTVECGYSAITRMELLGFPEITVAEDLLIQRRLAEFTYWPLTSTIEDVAIAVRRTRKVKLPDAIIAATAICHQVELLTLDVGLQLVARDGFEKFNRL
jgi:predicted nucleic acid-binding protein